MRDRSNALILRNAVLPIFAVSFSCGIGCAGANGTDQAGNIGGSSPSETGGAATTRGREMGGSTGTGEGNARGGDATVGGTTGTVDTKATGGNPATGNKSAASSSADGGVTAIGGNAPTGGKSSASSSANGGSAAIGGKPATGGRSSAGGKTGSDGAIGGGGTTVASGGKATGGASTGSTGESGAGGGSPGTALPLVYDAENTGADCTVVTTFPAFNALKSVANLPDPFMSDDGTTIATKADWRCRRAEISAQIQYWGTGPKGAPPSSLTATYSGGKLSVVVTQGSASITLSSTINTPSGAGPFPLLISVDGSGVPSNIFTSRGVATMTFTSSQLVPSSMSVTRGAGTYFTMYPDKNTGAMIEWAWGISRLIDGLYKTVDQNKIDLKHIAVTGCSYAGKVSLYAGAFDERIALTIPEESGGGGEASWRVMAGQSATEHLEAAQGTAWYAANLKQFKNADAPKLPYDQHELVAMIAPRAVLTIGNTAIDRLGSEAGYVSMKAATEVYKALGVPDRIGYSQNNTGTHCAFPSVQTADVAAFVDKFLLGKDASNVTKTPYNTDLKKWITWTTPALK